MRSLHYLPRPRSASALNYLEQLRPYSYADLLLLLFAAAATGWEIAACSLLWFGFLIHLEWRHEDVDRERWPKWACIPPWLIAITILPDPRVSFFFCAAYLYALKKRFQAVTLVSPLINGALKAALVLLVTTDIGLLAIVLAAASTRNLAGDVRDAEKDYAEGVRTIPIVLGYTRATPYVYPAALAGTSLLWTVLGDLPVWALGIAWAVQALTYRLTPR